MVTLLAAFVVTSLTLSALAVAQGKGPARWGRLALALLVAGTSGPAQAEGSATPTASTWKLTQVGNLARVPGLQAAHKELLAKQGCFLAPQDPPPAEPPVRSPNGDVGDDDPFSTSGATRTRTQATQLFHVYERNDFLRFPSLVTVDLAIATTHAYFVAAQRDLELFQLAPLLTGALVELLKEADAVRLAARGAQAREVARRAALFWAVALRLQSDKGVVPAAMRATTDKVVKAIVNGRPLPIQIVKADLDVAELRPHRHTSGSRELERYFRAMRWLELAAFPIAGEQADVEGLALVARAWLGSQSGREGLGRVLQVTSFLGGGANPGGLAEAAGLLERVLPGAAASSAEQLLAPDVLGKLQRELAASSMGTAAAVDSGQAARQVQVLGHEVSAEATALRGLLPVLMASGSDVDLAPAVTAMMGARGVAAALGSPIAESALLADVPGQARAALTTGLRDAHKALRAVAAERWGQDAYHGQLHALSTLLDPPSGKAPPLLDTPTWRLRALQSFAAGWAELRQDTVPSGTQATFDCDALDLEPPPSWVEPVPELYRRLAATVRRLEKRLASNGIDAGFKPDAKQLAGNKAEELVTSLRTPAEKTKLILDLLDRLAQIADQELKGLPLDAEARTWLSTIGRTVESMLAGFCNADVLNDRDADQAASADVFTWRPAAQVLMAGSAQPDLVYAIIPSPEGPVLARGAVMSYRELLRPQATPLTDEEWRSAIVEGRAPRPRWLVPLYADPVGPVTLPQATQRRCGPNSGASIDRL